MNRLFLLLFGMVTFVAHAQVPDYVPTEGLVGWYPFNGNANDESGNGNDGEINGATLTEDEYGNTNSAYYFDGNDRIDIAHHNDFDWSAMTFLIVYEDYDNPNAVPNGNSTLVTKQPGSGWGSGWGFSTGDENTEFGRCMTTTSGNECLGWGENEWGDWNMVAYTHSIDSVKVYFDGSLVSEEASFGGFIANSLPITIGMRGNGWHQFIGSISLIGMWDRILTEEEITALYNAQMPASATGCMDSAACNFDAEANEDNGSCIYPPSESVDCEFGGNYCGEGTSWDASLQECVGFNDCPSDLNGNGLVEVSDLLMVLADFGTECAASDDPEPAEWTCGDPVDYHSYDYATVQIGEQCWFAENLRATQYLDGSEIQPGDAVPFANNEANIDVYGLMYGGGVIVNESAVCPSNWHVPSLSNWQELVAFVGANGFSDNESAALRSVDGWTENGNGLDAFGFTGRPGGFHYDPIHPFWGEFAHNTISGYWWTSTLASAGNLFSATLQGQYLEPNYPISNGMSIRCLKD